MGQQLQDEYRKNRKEATSYGKNTACALPLINCCERSEQRHYFRRFSETRAPADGKNPVPADIMNDYPSAISAHSKMAVVACTTVIPFVLSQLGQTK